MAESRHRVMWLLNHSTARNFEVPMLQRIGFSEIFLPKSFPQEIGFRSGSVDRSQDASLSIPADDLAVLNAADWHGEPDRDTWEIANKYFDVLFFTLANPSFIRSVARRFRGAAILRAYGREEGQSYGAVLNFGAGGLGLVEGLGRRFWFGAASRHLAAIESPRLRERELYLPAGLQDCRVTNEWSGDDATVFVVCPDVAGNNYYAQIYRRFKEQLAGFRYAVGGAQSVASNEANVLGWVPDEQHRRNMREFRVMYYNSTEPNHLHYHPLEAVRAGMPLVFLGGGMLDRLGGIGLPGRCDDVAEARGKLRRILAGDGKVIAQIRASQAVLLNEMQPDKLEPVWRKGLASVVAELEDFQSQPARPVRSRRIAVIVPAAYRGGTLRSAKLLAQALWTGSRQCREAVEVVLAYPHLHDELADPWDAGLPAAISRRTFEWRRLDPAAARRAMRNAGHPEWVPAGEYIVPDDGIQHLCDCDLWIVVSDRLDAPLLPIRPYALAVYDYLQRYLNLIPPGGDQAFLSAASAAARVLVTTRFTEQDVLTYAGVPRKRVFRVPLLAPEFEAAAGSGADAPYFLWTTNLAAHKNHHLAICALREYYELLDGRLDCRVCGVATDNLLTSEFPYLKPLAALVASSKALAKHLQLLGEIPDALYQRQLANAAFLWHAATIDNGTLSVVEAAHLGVPSLSSQYPAMAEIDAGFGLNLVWMDARQPSQMARQLKWMEEHAHAVRARLPSKSDLATHSLENVAPAYWRAVRECL